MRVDRERFLEEGYLVVPEVVPADQLDRVRTAYERLIERQRVFWSRDRKPDDPPGGAWEVSAQPRLHLNRSPLAEQIDAESAPAVEMWLNEGAHGVSSELLGVPDAGVTEMMLMCSPLRDHGPAPWHRDLHPIDTAPLQGYIDDIVEGGPRYIQWNIPLYDDSVLWVSPGSHLRFNTEEENRRLLVDPRVPLPGAIQTHLRAGDGVAYILPVLHWGSNYSTRLRRTVHGGFSTFTLCSTSGFAEQLSPAVRDAFERWGRRSAELQRQTELALRAVIVGDGAGYVAALDRLHPGRGEKGRLLSTVFLTKAACFIYLHQGLDPAGISEELRRRGAGAHAITLNWGPAFAARFSAQEATALWSRFRAVDLLLQGDDEEFYPGFQSGPMRYRFNEMPSGYTVADFIAGWSAPVPRR
jgi:hypothetical protein